MNTEKKAASFNVPNTNHPLDTILNQSHQFLILTTYFSKIRFNIIICSVLWVSTFLDFKKFPRTTRKLMSILAEHLIIFSNVWQLIAMLCALQLGTEFGTALCPTSVLAPTVTLRTFIHFVSYFLLSYFSIRPRKWNTLTSVGPRTTLSKPLI
jgi:hypothetical protein